MGRTIKEWKKIIADSCDRSLMEREVSLHTLMSWVAFHESYEWTGLNILKDLIREELNKRNIKWGEVILTLNPAFCKHEKEVK